MRTPRTAITAALTGLLAVGLFAGSPAQSATVVPAPEIRGYVWHDLDLDGVKDAGEPGIGNAKVKLSEFAGSAPGSSCLRLGEFWECDTPDQVVQDRVRNAAGEPVPSVTTDSTGFYAFPAQSVIQELDYGYLKPRLDRTEPQPITVDTGRTDYRASTMLGLSNQPIDFRFTVIPSQQAPNGRAQFRLVDRDGAVVNSVSGVPAFGEVTHDGSFDSTTVLTIPNIARDCARPLVFLELLPGSSWALFEATSFGGPDSIQRFSQPLNRCDSLPGSTEGAALAARGIEIPNYARIDGEIRGLDTLAPNNHVTLAIKGPEGNPVPRADGLGVVAPVRTDSAGSYTFNQVPVREIGRYHVTVVWRESPGLVGLRPTESSADWYSVKTAPGWVNDVQPDVGPLFFEDRPATNPRVTIKGVAFEDQNRDGVRQPTEPAVRGGVSLDLLGEGYPATTPPIKSIVTQADGTYRFTGLQSLCDRSYVIRLGFTGVEGYERLGSRVPIRACRWNDYYTLTLDYPVKLRAR